MNWSKFFSAAFALFIVVLVGGAIFIVAYGDDLQRKMIERGDGHAEISAASVVAQGKGTTLELTLTFKSAPRGDTQALVIDAESSAMAKRSWTWAEISEADDDPSTTPSTPPQVGKTIHVKLPLHLFRNVLVSKGKAPGINVFLTWGGKRQHGKNISLAHLFS